MSVLVKAVGQTGDLLKSIDRKKQELVHLAMSYGFVDEKTIKCSQDLDDLINLYIKSINDTKQKSLQ